jgi:hypothetical protein
MADQKRQRRIARVKKREAQIAQGIKDAVLLENHSCDMSKLNRAPSLDHSTGEDVGNGLIATITFEGYHCPTCRKKYVKMSWQDAEGTQRVDWRSIVKFDGQGDPVLA